MNIDALHRLMREGDVIVGRRCCSIDPRGNAAVARALKEMPAVAGAGFKRAVAPELPRDDGGEHEPEIFINVLFAGIIAFGVVYNAARVSLSERSRELASLRVLGFTRAEISLILLGELALLTLAALPVGAAVRLRAVGRSSSDIQQRGLSLSAVRVPRRPSPGPSWASSRRRLISGLMCDGGSTGSIWWRC